MESGKAQGETKRTAEKARIEVEMRQATVRRLKSVSRAMQNDNVVCSNGTFTLSTFQIVQRYCDVPRAPKVSARIHLMDSFSASIMVSANSIHIDASLKEIVSVFIGSLS